MMTVFLLLAVFVAGRICEAIFWCRSGRQNVDAGLNDWKKSS